MFTRPIKRQEKIMRILDITWINIIMCVIWFSVFTLNFLNSLRPLLRVFFFLRVLIEGLQRGCHYANLLRAYIIPSSGHAEYLCLLTLWHPEVSSWNSPYTNKPVTFLIWAFVKLFIYYRSGYGCNIHCLFWNQPDTPHHTVYCIIMLWK